MGGSHGSRTAFWGWAMNNPPSHLPEWLEALREEAWALESQEQVGTRACRSEMGGTWEEGMVGMGQVG